MLKKLFLFAVPLMALVQNIFAQQPQIAQFSVTSDSCFIGAKKQFSATRGSVSNPVPNLSVKTYWGDGSSEDISVSTQGSFYGDHIYSSPGTYSAMAVLFNAANTPIDTNRFTVNAFCSTLWGAVYKKNGINCIYDPLTEKILNFPLRVEVRKNNVPSDTFTANGYFTYQIPSPDITSEYSLHPLNITEGYQLTCPAPSSPYRVRLDTLQTGATMFNFGFECDNNNTGFDLYTYMSGLFRFTGSSYLQLSVGNVACAPHNGTVTLNISPKYIFASASITPSSVAGQTVTWNLNNIEGSNSPKIQVTLNARDTLTPGDTTCNRVSITPTSGDINVSNNSYSSCDSIRASYDPNEKHVAPLGAIEAGQLLTYTINFENLGNDTAFNVHLLDTLSTNLDVSSFELLHSSHPVATNLMDFENTKVARFDFKDINLRDKDHPESNKGFVIYQVKAKMTMAKGEEIANTAYIYFDINPAVVTNTVLSKIPDLSNIARLRSEDGVQVYPNPVNNKLFLEDRNGTFRNVILINALGQTVQEQALSKGINEMNMATLSPGLYYLILHGEGGTRSLKITRQ